MPTAVQEANTLSAEKLWSSRRSVFPQRPYGKVRVRIWNLRSGRGPTEDALSAWSHQILSSPPSVRIYGSHSLTCISSTCSLPLARFSMFRMRTLQTGPVFLSVSVLNVGCRQECTADAAVGRPHRGTRRRTPRAAAAAATALQQTLTQPTDLWPDLHTVGHSGCPDTKTLHPLLYTLIPEQLYSHKQALGTAAATSTTAVLQLHWLWLQLSPLL